MATAQFELAPPAGYTVQTNGTGQKLLPTGLTYDGTNYSGADGEYDVYNIGATGMWQLEVVTLGEAVEPDPEPEPDPDPEPETATTTFQLAPPAGFAMVVMASGYDDYAFQGWVDKPIAGVTQVLYSTADNTTLSSNGELQTDSATSVEMYAISGTGMWTYAPITNLDQLPVADGPTLDAPTLVSEIPNQTATESEAFSLDLAPFFNGDEITYSAAGWAAATVTGSTLSVTPSEADVTASPISVTATATNAAGSVSSTFSVTVESAVVAPQVPQGLLTFGTPSIAATSWSYPYSYDGDDATGFEHRINGGEWVESTSPVSLPDATAETTYTLDVRPYNDTGTGSVVTATITTEEDVSVPEPGETIVERVYTINASIDQIPASQKFTMYQGDRVRLNITHNFDMTGKQLKFRIASHSGQQGKFTLTTEANTIVISTATAELLNTSDRAWQLILRDGESLVVVADGSVEVRNRIKGA